MKIHSTSEGDGRSLEIESDLTSIYTVTNMGIIRLNFKSSSQPKTVFVTAGPWCDANRSMAKQSCITFLESIGPRLSRSYGPCFETSEDGYQHIHMVIEAITKTRWAKHNTQLLNLCREWNVINDQSQQPNTWFGIVPNTESTNGKSGFDHIGIKYLTNPSKLKVCDDTMDIHNADINPQILVHSEIRQQLYKNEPLADSIAIAVAHYERQIKKEQKGKADYRKHLIKFFAKHPDVLKERLRALDSL